MTVDIFVPGEGENAASRALADMMRGHGEGKSFADMIRYRISGASADVCRDVYYVAHEDGRALCRLWNGWGKHENAVGNFGNFFTLEEARGRGIGRAVLQAWAADLAKTERKPLALFCSAKEEIAPIYFPYGFRPAFAGGSVIRLYCPLGDSPATFRAFCERYYRPTNALLRRRATVEWRHEIDCLLKFALLDAGLPFGIGEYNLEAALLYRPGAAGLLFTEEGRCVGWSLDGQTQLHPRYAGMEP